MECNGKLEDQREQTMPPDCSVEALFPGAEELMKSGPRGFAINQGGPHGFDTRTEVFAVADDPIGVPGCEMALVRFLDGSPIALRYRRHDIIYEHDVVELTDGRQGTIIPVYEGKNAFSVEIPGEPRPDIVDIEINQIAYIVKQVKPIGRVYHIDEEQLRSLILMSMSSSDEDINKDVSEMETWANSWDTATRGRE